MIGLGWSRQDQIKKIQNELFQDHDENILYIGGRGSFFLKNLKERYNLEQDRTIDIDIVVNDVDLFYESWISDMGSEKAFRFAEINKKTPLYKEDPSQNVRLTIIPQDKLKDWTTLKTSPIGYFLIGRWQKPMNELFVSSQFQEEFDETKERIYDEGTKLALQTYGASFFGNLFNTIRNYETEFDNVIKGHASLDMIIKHLYHLSYTADGIRTIEAFLKAKPDSCLNNSLEKSREIYYDRIRTEAEIQGLRMVSGNIFSFNSRDSQEKAKRNLKRFKRWAIPNSAYVMYYLNQTNDNPHKYTREKIARSFSPTKIARINYLLAYLKDPVLAWNLAKLPEGKVNLDNLDSISKINGRISQLKMKVYNELPIKELNLAA